MSSIRSTPIRQPFGAMMLNRMITVTVNAACPTAKEIASGVKAATKTAIGSRSHRIVGSVPMPTMIAPPMMMPITVPMQRSQRRGTGGERVGAQHRQCAEHDPEALLLTGETGDQDGQGQTDRATHAVLQPRRVAIEVTDRDALGGAGFAEFRAVRSATKEAGQPRPGVGGGDARDGRRGQFDDVAQFVRRVEGAVELTGRAGARDRTAGADEIAAVAMRSPSVAMRSSSVATTSPPAPTVRAAPRSSLSVSSDTASRASASALIRTSSALQSARLGPPPLCWSTFAQASSASADAARNR